uniref:Uncharacterized protein n=1 Tax=Arundo donax TaxID=35708 RepID=A0A0A9A4H1_ARUDO
MSFKHSHACAVVSCSRKWSSQPYPVSSSSGPTRMAAPAALACAMDSLTLRRLVSKSIAHWFRLQVATRSSLILPPESGAPPPPPLPLRPPKSRATA